MRQTKTVFLKLRHFLGKAAACTLKHWGGYNSTYLSIVYVYFQSVCKQVNKPLSIWSLADLNYSIFDGKEGVNIYLVRKLLCFNQNIGDIILI